jgi:hypothetical protein
MGFEPTIPVLERVETVHALDSAATVIGTKTYNIHTNSYSSEYLYYVKMLQIQNPEVCSQTIEHYHWSSIT